MEQCDDRNKLARNHYGNQPQVKEMTSVVIHEQKMHCLVKDDDEDVMVSLETVRKRRLMKTVYFAENSECFWRCIEDTFGMHLAFRIRLGYV